MRGCERNAVLQVQRRGFVHARQCGERRRLGPSVRHLPGDRDRSGWTHNPRDRLHALGWAVRSPSPSHWTASPGSPSRRRENLHGQPTRSATLTTTSAHVHGRHEPRPTAAVTFPASGSVYGAGTWTGTIAGSASDRRIRCQRRCSCPIKDTTTRQVRGRNRSVYGYQLHDELRDRGWYDELELRRGSPQTSPDGDSYTRHRRDDRQRRQHQHHRRHGNAWTYDTTVPTPVSVVAADGGSQNDPGEIDHDNRDDTLNVHVLRQHRSGKHHNRAPSA